MTKVLDFLVWKCTSGFTTYLIITFVQILWEIITTLCICNIFSYDFHVICMRLYFSEKKRHNTYWASFLPPCFLPFPRSLFYAKYYVLQQAEGERVYVELLLDARQGSSSDYFISSYTESTFVQGFLPRSAVSCAHVTNFRGFQVTGKVWMTVGVCFELVYRRTNINFLFIVGEWKRHRTK